MSNGNGRRGGGPIADPIREMVADPECDGAVFHCEDVKQAENTRYAAIMLKHRNGFSFKTTRRGHVLIVYKNDADPFEMRNPISKSLF